MAAKEFRGSSRAETSGTTVASLLRERLKAKGLTQIALSQVAQVDRNVLCALLSGKKPPRSRTGRVLASDDERYTRIAKCLGIPVPDFIALVEREQRSGEFTSSSVHEEPAIIWVAFLEQAHCHDVVLLEHVRYFHGVYFDCVAGQVYQPPTGVQVPELGVRRRGLLLLARLVYEIPTPSNIPPLS